MNTGKPFDTLRGRLWLTAYGAATTPIEIGAGLYAAVWGLYLLLPFDTFATARAYDLLSTLAGETAWGGGMLLIGLVQVLAALGLLGDRATARFIAFVGCLAWLFIAVTIGLSTGWAAAGVAHFLLAGVGADLYLDIRLTGVRR